MARTDTPPTWSERATLVQMLRYTQETARHNGHLNLLREMADGSVGS